MHVWEITHLSAVRDTTLLPYSSPPARSVSSEFSADLGRTGLAGR